MKNAFLALILLSLFSVQVKAQDDTTAKSAQDTLLPYQKHTGLPAFYILGLDSVEKFNTYNIPTGKYTLLMLFGADCSHCKHFTEKMTAGMDSLKNLQIYMFSPSELSEIRDFAETYHLKNYKNIKFIGRDYDFFFYTYYGAKFVPYLALYDKHKKLVKVFPDGVTVKELYELTHK